MYSSCLVWGFEVVVFSIVLWCLRRLSVPYHNEVPHAGRLSNQGGHGATTRHQDDFNGLRVQKVIQQLGGLAGITLWTQG